MKKDIKRLTKKFNEYYGKEIRLKADDLGVTHIVCGFKYECGNGYLTFKDGTSIHIDRVDELVEKENCHGENQA